MSEFPVSEWIDDCVKQGLELDKLYKVLEFMVPFTMDPEKTAGIAILVGLRSGQIAPKSLNTSM
jgi:hypothetical protein